MRTKAIMTVCSGVKINTQMNGKDCSAACAHTRHTHRHTHTGTHRHGQLILNRSAKLIQWREDSLLTNDVGILDYPYAK